VVTVVFPDAGGTIEPVSVLVVVVFGHETGGDVGVMLSGGPVVDPVSQEVLDGVVAFPDDAVKALSVL